MDIKPKTTCLALAMLAALAGMANDVVIENAALRAHPQADAIMSVFKKYEDMKFSGQRP